MYRKGKVPYSQAVNYIAGAYDFRHFGDEGPGDYCRMQEAKANTKRKKKRLRSPAMAVASILCVVLLFAGIMSQAELVAISNETVAVQKSIDELMHEQTFLKIRHEMAFSLEETEQYAIDVLGMKKPSAQQIQTIDVSETESKDTQQNEDDEGRDILSQLKEYFPG